MIGGGKDLSFLFTVDQKDAVREWLYTGISLLEICQKSLSRSSFGGSSQLYQSGNGTMGADRNNSITTLNTIATLEGG